MSANKSNRLFLALSLFTLIGLQACRYDELPSPKADTGFPESVDKIITGKCATAGCHNDISFQNAGGLDFSTWDVTFRGGRNGSSIIPYSTSYSYCLYFVNTDSTRGPVLEPTMPYQAAPLSNAEYQTLYDWIANGAPNKDGFVKYSDDPDREKVYICMQGCDQVAVFDAASQNIMRYIPVGNDPGQIEAPHQVRVSPDGVYWYVVFYAGSVLQKFRTSDDSLVATFNIGFGDWNTIIFTPDGSRGFVNGTNINTTAVVDLVNNTVITQISPELPHGGFVTPDGHWLYLTSQVSNFINKVDITDPGFSFDPVILQPGEPKLTTSRYDPHEAVLSPDGTKYFVSCQTSDEIRVFRLSDDSLLKIIPVGTKPQEFAESTNKPYLYITCTEEVVDVNRKGLVYVINYNTLELVDSIYTGYQPHGIDFDPVRKLVYVANLNVDNTGPAPHHVSDCGGRNGYITIIDEQTLELYRRSFPDGSTSSYKNEVLRAPYFVAYRKRP